MIVLHDLVIVFAAAVAVVTVLQRLRVPPIAGLIVAGALIGPNALGLVRNTEQVAVLAEVGVVMLLFGVGVELSLDRLRRLWRPIAIGGALQVLLTTAITWALARSCGLPGNQALVLGFLFSASSTAIVLRALDERSETDAPHGRLTLGILVFQDLCVVPMMLVLPLLSQKELHRESLTRTFLITIALLTGVFVAARVIAPWILDLAAKTRRRDLFVLVVFLICIGTAWAASQAGVSIALGAFFAGLVVAGSDYRSQALSDIIPFREVLSSLFFVSVGMVFSPMALWNNLGLIAALLAFLLLGKFIIVLSTGVLMRLPLRVCILAATALAQIGEFSFIMVRSAQDIGIVSAAFVDNIILLTILSMVITPMILALGPKLAAGAGKIRGLNRLLDVQPAEDVSLKSVPSQDHVIIAGFGVAGEELARALKTFGVPYLIVDLNVENVRRANKSGEPAFFGDVTSGEVLDHLGIRRAREFVLAINDPEAAARAVQAARSAAPAIHIVVRSRYLGDIARMKKAGATQVIPAELEAAVELVAHVMGRHGIERSRLEPELARVRLRQTDPC